VCKFPVENTAPMIGHGGLSCLNMRIFENAPNSVCNSKSRREPCMTENSFTTWPWLGWAASTNRGECSAFRIGGTTRTSGLHVVNPPHQFNAKDSNDYL